MNKNEFRSRMKARLDDSLASVGMDPQCSDVAANFWPLEWAAQSQGSLPNCWARVRRLLVARNQTVAVRSGSGDSTPRLVLLSDLSWYGVSLTLTSLERGTFGVYEMRDACYGGIGDKVFDFEFGPNDIDQKTKSELRAMVADRVASAADHQLERLRIRLMQLQQSIMTEQITKALGLPEDLRKEHNSV